MKLSDLRPPMAHLLTDDELQELRELAKHFVIEVEPSDRPFFIDDHKAISETIILWSSHE